MNLFLSDLHLESPETTKFATFGALLRAESTAVEAIYLLGDVCEVWIGDDDDGPLATALVALLRATTRRCPVYLLHGNRDFLIGPQFARATGVTLLDDPHRLPDGTLLSHGDALCIDDEAYQQARRQIRSPQWQREVLNQSLAQRREMAIALRAESRAANANKSENIMDVASREVLRVTGNHAARRLIHGHTHRPGVHRESWGERFVLGSWERCGWLVRQQGQHARLECFPLTGRYENETRHRAGK